MVHVVLLPEPRQLRVSLHSREDRDDMFGENGLITFVILLPPIKSTIWSDIESLFGRGRFSKGITDVGSEY
jgi:hypothetical protein